jgi:hypothetical protein
MKIFSTIFLLNIFLLTITCYDPDEETSYGLAEESEVTSDEIINELDKLMRIKVKGLLGELITEADRLFQKCPPTKDFLNSIMIKKSNNQKCSDPTPSVMMANLVKIQYILKDLSGMLDIAYVQDVFKKYINNHVPITKNSFVFGSKRCNDNLANLTQINEMTTCPWHTRIEIRENRYPHMVSHARCNCLNCMHLKVLKDDVKYRCQELYRLSPALIRDEHCDGDERVGVYEWKPILEKIAVSCVCSRSNKPLIATYNELF